MLQMHVFMIVNDSLMIVLMHLPTLFRGLHRLPGSESPLNKGRSRGGGGEGSTAREVLRHKSVEKCVGAKEKDKKVKDLKEKFD